MNRNPFKRKPLSKEKVAEIRKQICEAYKLSKGEELITPSNKGSVYYQELSIDIEKRTNGKTLSEGTLCKIMTDKSNFNFEVLTLEIVEEYIESCDSLKGSNSDLELSILERFHDNQDLISRESSKAEIFNILSEPKTSIFEFKNALEVFVSSIYIELVTRKAGLKFDDQNDIIVNVYSSWYKLFCTIREEMKKFPSLYFIQLLESEPVLVAKKILEDILRPHLTKYYPNFSKWYNSAVSSEANKLLSPIELQKQYCDYSELVKSLKEVNLELIEISNYYFIFLKNNRVISI
jgi:hypothetical protein